MQPRPLSVFAICLFTLCLAGCGAEPEGQPQGELNAEAAIQQTDTQQLFVLLPIERRPIAFRVEMEDSVWVDARDFRETWGAKRRYPITQAYENFGKYLNGKLVEGDTMRAYVPMPMEDRPEIWQYDMGKETDTMFVSVKSMRDEWDADAQRALIQTHNPAGLYVNHRRID